MVDTQYRMLQTILSRESSLLKRFLLPFSFFSLDWNPRFAMKGSNKLPVHRCIIGLLYIEYAFKTANFKQLQNLNIGSSCIHDIPEYNLFRITLDDYAQQSFCTFLTGFIFPESGKRIGYYANSCCKFSWQEKNFLNHRKYQLSFFLSGKKLPDRINNGQQEKNPDRKNNTMFSSLPSLPSFLLSVLISSPLLYHELLRHVAGLPFIDTHGTYSLTF